MVANLEYGEKIPYKVIIDLGDRMKYPHKS